MITSDNVISADNQQERLIFIGWIVGFVDGEGCFSIGFVKQPDTSKRCGYSTGYQVVHRFAITQGVKSLSCIEDIHAFFNVGRLQKNLRNDNHKEDLVQYIVNKEQDLLETIIPFFQKYPLNTSKRYDFEQFVKCMRIIEQRKHKTRKGLIDIAQIAQTMNHRKSREDLIRILRDYTPNAQIKSEDIVPSA